MESYFFSCHMNQTLRVYHFGQRTPPPSTRSFSCAPSPSIVGFRLVPRKRNELAVKASVNGDDDDTSESKGQQLWRKELQSSNELGLFDDEKLQNSEIQKDIRRLAKKEKMERILKRPYKDDAKEAGAEESRGALLSVTEKILVADFFFILFILAWLVAAVAEQSFLDSSKLIDSWLPLWPSVFQPALGVFMAGAIVSAVAKKKDP
ncbi:hypothetical protein Mapa_010055 [Marchantia paleacea]|nr:hypothetical protein Mapa_010055 [Marchantia paleacea]